MWEFLKAIFLAVFDNPEKLTVSVLLLLIAGFLWWQYTKVTRALIKSKDDEIKRLAEDNRRYREIYLTKVKGLLDTEYKKISGERIDRTAKKRGKKDSK